MEDTALKTEMTAQEMQDLINQVKQLQSQDSETQEQSPEDLPQFNEADLVDEYGLPFEPEGYYNAAPLQFEETASYLWYFVDVLNYTATRYNRHSPAYFSILKELEKDIKKLGQFCITRAVMEKSGTKFEKIGETPIRELYCMVSLHFRKCCGAAIDIQKEQKGVDLSLIGWIFRFADLAERLKATEDKIQKIKDGKISIDKMLEPAEIYKNEPKMQRDNSAKKVQPSMRAPSSLSVIKSFSKEVEQEKKRFDKVKKKSEREAERVIKQLEKRGYRLRKTNEPKTYQPMSLPKKVEQDSGVRDQGSETLKDSNFNVQSSNIVPDRRIRSGPSDETRKKLREKRKKKK